MSAIASMPTFPQTPNSPGNSPVPVESPPGVLPNEQPIHSPIPVQEPHAPIPHQAPEPEVPHQPNPERQNLSARG